MEMESLDPAQAFMAKITERFKPVHDITARGTSSVQQFYHGSTAFMTGGSGFLGKQLIEKLLRATKISKIYVLLRCKKGKTVQQRLEETLKDPLYDKLREQQPDFVDKVVAVSGDVSELKLGLSEKDWNTIADEVDLIFHLAATTRFDETLKTATFINVRGTREIVTLGKACKKLRSFVYVSTAFSHARDEYVYGEVLEKFSPSPVSPETMIGIAETMEEERIIDITTKLIKSWPNTYTFTKAIAEDIVNTMGKDLPICVVRPAVVTCTIREPAPGWVDKSCIYGASGYMYAVGLGVSHVAYGNHSNQLDLVPVDYVNNTILAAAWETARLKSSAPEENEIKIYVVSSRSRNPVTWSDLQIIMAKEGRKFPTPQAVGYTFAWCTSNQLVFWIYSWLLHLIPAYTIDTISVLFGNKRRFGKLAQKLSKMKVALSHFMKHYWKFEDQNTVTLLSSLSEDDREIFDFDVTKIQCIIRFAMATETLDPAQAFITKIANRLKPVQEITARGTSNVQQFYCGATVFVTGGSGFLGKHLIEKLFRATKVSKIYVLLRCKKGKSVNQRLFEMLKDPPEFVDKIVAVSGDVSELKLGLSGKDWNTIADEVDIILHLAATTRFDETLKTATFINVRGTRELLNIGKACKKLRSFVYVSTAFTHARADRVDQTISEKFYPSPISPETMIGIAETMDEGKIYNITSSLIKNWPNTYTYTKAVAESLVEAMGKDLPICVVRPAIGALHATYVKEDNIMELVPVDYVNNAILVAAWETAKTKTSVPEENEIKIYTVTSSSRNALYWREKICLTM
ncbi:hypothetical protein HW555_000601 [Spodoptera exigua]|uniref:Fatty acyl-CoA reductase n=1 Tax=Spodoptera exigua TaxID=7107 RepID=A0A835GVP5_SPOEX|nr:hypothetical protein HW555_000601 [Spodoptera exigua]